MKIPSRAGLGLLLLVLGPLQPCFGRAAGQEPAFHLLVTVVDENRVPVSSARVGLLQSGQATARHCETNYAGRCDFTGLAPGAYEARVEKEGFYAFTSSEVRAGEAESLEITLNHQQEFKEVMNVVSSAPSIDPSHTVASGSLGLEEIVHLPYLVTRDIRYALPLLPGVLQDANGQVHVDGSAARQTFDELDGFNVGSPISGLFNMRVSVDAIRSVEVESSRIPAEYGKGSGGVLSLTTGMGDDHFRFSATDFIPALQGRKGPHVKTWTPRATFSGPIRKGRAWFLDALDGEYDQNILKDLPVGADRGRAWRVSNLAKSQINLTQANRLTASLLTNRFHSTHAGLSRFNPLEATLNLNQRADLFTVKDQAYLSSGWLVEAGFGASRFYSEALPLGNLPFEIRPEGASGNFFEMSRGRSARDQWIANLYAPPRSWHGRHEVKLGVDLDRLTDRQFSDRRPLTILREDGTRARQAIFTNVPAFGRNNFEESAFAQDRWTVSDRWLVSGGVRLDRDGIVRRLVASPRLASSYLLTRDGQTKLSLGIGFYYETSNLDFITRPLAGQRLDLFFAPDGQTPSLPPLETSFQVNEAALRGPRFLNWSAGVERKLPASFFLQTEFLEKRGRHQWTFVPLESGAAGLPSGQFELETLRRDRIHAFQVILRRTFKTDASFLVAYTWSSARSNAVLDFNLGNPVFAQQAGGPLPWDSPKRLISWGWLPVGKGFELAYSLDWRDGYPFSLVNETQHLIGLPGSRRLPDYISLNLHLERRFRVFGLLWAVRAGFDDITNRANPSSINNNVDSRQFGTVSGIQGRALTGRIRLLGRK